MGERLPDAWLAELERDAKRGYGAVPVYPRVLVLLAAYRRLLAKIAPATTGQADG